MDSLGWHSAHHFRETQSNNTTRPVSRSKKPLPPPRDHFTALPTELIHAILSYLISRHSALPNVTGRDYRETNYIRAIILHEQLSDLEALRIRLLHPLLHAAGTCRALREAVEGYSLSLLKQYAAAAKFKDQGPRNTPVTFRGQWVRFLKNKCMWCGKRTTRHAIFNCLAHCCVKCDRNQFRAKITKTDAMKIYKLHFDDLVDPESRYQGHGLKPLNMAVYNCQGVDTTMFFKHEVEERAKVVHGDYFYDGKVHKKKKGDDMDGGLRDTVPRTKKK